jgi:hypothetical protein
MMLRGHKQTAAAGHLRVEWQSCAAASSGLTACPNIPSSRLCMQRVGATNTGSPKSEGRLFSDYSRNMH